VHSATLAAKGFSAKWELDPMGPMRVLKFDAHAVEALQALGFASGRAGSRQGSAATGHRKNPSPMDMTGCP
jgi:hypothetical protein